MSNRPPRMLPFKSAQPWRHFPAALGREGTRYLSLIYQWERSQWAHPEELARQTLFQRQALLHAAFHASSHYEERLSEIGFDPEVPLTEERWSEVPLLTRSDLQMRSDLIRSHTVPPGQDDIRKSYSSGSTGQPIAVDLPAIKNAVWLAATIYEHLIHDRDFSAKAAAIRVRKKRDIGPEGVRSRDWGRPFSYLFETGPATLMGAHVDPEAQADWLIRENPAYLLSFPSTLEAMIPILRDKGANLDGLHHFRTLSEQLPPALREDVRDIFGKKVVDMYSAQEVGYIALQCPMTDHYHLHQDLNFTEILKDDGAPAAPGEVGRVVVTDIFNLAFPIIRYDIGDYAEVGEPCACGRSHPVITRVMGRVRNLVTLPDGSRHWPLTASRNFRELGGITQFQLVQKSLDLVEAKVVAPAPLNPDQKDALTKMLQDRLTYPFTIDIQEVSEIPRGANGKYEEFKSEVTPPLHTSSSED